MKRREFLKVGAAGVTASALAAPAIAQSMPEVRWRLTASWPKSLDTLYGACETIAKYVAEATDQKFQIQVFAAGEIVPALQVLDACQNGTVEIGHTATYYYIGKDPTWALFCAVPFGLNTRQQNAWFYDGDGMKLMNEFGKKYNVHSLVGGNTGAQMGGWFRKEIKTVDDLKGLKMRLAGPAADAHLEAFEIVDGLDLFTEPAAHLCAGVAADKRVHVVLLAKLVHQFHAVAVVEPRVLLTGIQPERDGTEQCPGRILADVVVRGGVADLDRAILAGVEHLQCGYDLACGEDLDLKLLVGGLGHVFCDRFASAVERIERFRPTRRQPPSDLRHRLCNGRRSQSRGGHSGGANFEKFAAFHGLVSS